MSSAAELLDRLGRPADLKLATAEYRLPVRRLSCGVDSVDQLLGGGLLRGKLTVVVSELGAGGTTLFATIASSATRAGEVVAWLDPADQLDPEGLAHCGAVLERLLWVRPNDHLDALRAADLLLRSDGFGLVILDLATAAIRSRPGMGVWTRLQQAVERTRSVLLVLAPTDAVSHGGALTLGLSLRRVRWGVGAGRRPVLDGIDLDATIRRHRLGPIGRHTAVSWRTVA